MSTLNGCTDTYEDYLDGNVSTNEPYAFCGSGYVSESTPSGTKTYGQITCLDKNAVLINGVMANGPNEGDRGAWGDPGLEPFNELAEGPGASLDYCGGHTGMSMHYHFAYEACFDKNEDKTPSFSYAIVGTEFDQKKIIDGECTQPSGIVGWSIDGYPVKGPCVCAERAEDGSCSSVKRARTSWLYAGIAAQSSAPNPELLAVEGKACEETSDCCAERPCDFACNNVVTAGDNAGSQVEKVCTFVRQAWCSREYTNMEDKDVSTQNFVYLDVCNGYNGPDGFAYHSIGTFPYLQSCFHGEPAQQAATAGGGGPGGGGPGGGPGGPGGE
jgi:hypothetical protein